MKAWPSWTGCRSRYHEDYSIRTRLNRNNDQMSQSTSKVTINSKSHNQFQMSQSTLNVTINSKCHNQLKMSQSTQNVTINSKFHNQLKISQSTQNVTINSKYNIFDTSSINDSMINLFCVVVNVHKGLSSDVLERACFYYY